MKAFSIVVLLLIMSERISFAQADSSVVKRIRADTSKMLMNLDAIYNRPFLQVGKSPVAVGGYLEANSEYAVTNGISEGLSFQMRRMTLFLASTISKRIKFLSEIEFEGGTKEINIEFAAMDLELHPLFILRGGIIMNPIGAFNQNHDGPKWEFIDRPISAVQLLPATWSNVGFGLHGKKYNRDWVYAYEVYLTNGFDDRIVANAENKTFLPATKLNPDRFEESPNGVPLLTAKVGLRRRNIGEIGLSYMGGTYNKFQQDGITIDKRRRVDTWAFDFNTRLPSKTYITGEVAFVHVDVPSTYTQQYGSQQWGGFVDFVQPIYRKPVFGFEKSVVNFSLRLQYVDWNTDRFKETGTPIAEDIISIVPALGFRPTPQTVLRINYGYQWKRDLFGNPAAKTGIFQVGFSTYF